tara:strand:- start:1473 stop:2345 length:873 start_codon:yes stop_codon:yes gene_type:complete
MRKVKHSKIRNTGLLYEFLLRQITSEILEKTKKEKAIKVVKLHFNENTNLGRELSLYNLLMNKKFKDDKKAEFFVNEVINERRKINNSTLRREKYNLIKSLKETYDLGKFLSSKVKNYKTYASIYKLFEHNTISPEEKTESHFNLVEHITTQKTEIKLSETIGGTPLPKDEDLRILTYRTLLEKFNQKYSKLNIPQKSLLRAYINNVSNTNSLKEFIEKVTPVLKKDLKKYTKSVKDKVVKIKLKEAINSINKFCNTGNTRVVKDSVVVQTMRYMELLKELKKSGNKKVI